MIIDEFVAFVCLLSDLVPYESHSIPRNYSPLT